MITTKNTELNAELAWLTGQFPDVPQRITVAVFISYLRVSRTVQEAARAAHVRIADACAV